MHVYFPLPSTGNQRGETEIGAAGSKVSMSA